MEHAATQPGLMVPTTRDFRPVTTQASIGSLTQTVKEEGESRMVDDRRAERFDEEFKPKGTVAIVIAFTATLILLWLSIYLILVARGVTQV